MALKRARDDLERLFDGLVGVLLERSPDRLDLPIPVGELYQDVLPYRALRASRQFDTHQDYEMALLRLLAGERGLARVEPEEVGDALRRQAAAPSPDPGAFRAFPDALVRLDASAIQMALDSREAYAPPPASTTDPPDAGGPEDLPPPTPTTVSAMCFQCERVLPAGRAVLFCPYCGANLRQRQCPGCGTRMEQEWSFCITCGRG